MPALHLDPMLPLTPRHVSSRHHRLQVGQTLYPADTSRPDLTPQFEPLLAISYGLSANFRDDHEMLKHGMVMYDAP